MVRPRVGVALLLVVVGAATPRQLARAGEPLRLAAEAPPGFEDLMRPQSTLVDVRWGGQHLGRVLATFRPGKLRFQEPRALVDLIPNVIGRERVVDALTGELPAHPERVCGAARLPGCNRLEPDVAGIIFDASVFTVRVFINPAFLSSRRAAEREFLPPPDTGLSFVQSLQASLLGVEGARPSVGLYSASTLAYDETRLTAELSVSDTTGARVESAHAEFDLTRTRISAGILRPAGSPFVRTRRLVGMALSAAADRLWTPREAYSSPLPIFLPRAARVAVWRGGRLLHSAEHEAGNVLLDTSSFPDGAYDVVVRVHELTGGQWHETRAVVKTARVPPAAYPLWRFELGANLDEPELRPIARLGTTHRVAPSLALGGDVFARDDLVIAEASLFWLTPWFRVELGGYGSSDLDGGLRLSAAGQVGRAVAWAVGFRGVWRPTLAPQRTITPAATTTQASADLSWAPHARVRLALRARWTQLPDEAPQLSGGPALSWSIFSLAPLALTLDAQAQWTDDALHASAFVRLRYTPASQLTLNVDGGGALAGQAGGDPELLAPLGRAILTLSDGDWLDDELTLRGGVVRNEHYDVAQAEARYRGALGQLSLRGERPLGRDAGPGRLAVRAILNGAFDRQGAIFGGDRTASSAIVVQLDGDDRDAVFAVRVGRGPDGHVIGGTHARIRVGQRVGLFLPPNHRYQVSLEQIGGDPAEVDLDVRSVTLLPGTVQTLVWSAGEVITVFGRLVDAAGAPVADVPLGGVRGIAATDGQGYFLAQVRQRAILTARAPSGHICKIPLNRLVVDARQRYVRVGTRICR